MAFNKRLINTKPKILALFSVFGLLLFQLLWIDKPFINLEYVFLQGSDFVLTGNFDSLNYFFQRQANNLSLPFLIGIFRYLGFNNYAAAHISGYISLLIIVVISIKEIDSIYTLMVLSNPLIFIYGSRAYPEVPSLAMLFLGFYFYKKNMIFKSYLFLWSSFVLKYTNIAMYASISIFRIINYRKKAKEFLFPFTLGLGLVIFIIIYFVKFNIFIFPIHFRQAFVFDYSVIFTNFIYYSSILGIFLFPGYPVLSKRYYYSYIYPILILLFSIVFYGTINPGEADFGPLDAILIKYNIHFLFYAIGSTFLFSFILAKKTTRNLLLITIFTILILSLTRPAQRYIISLFPIVYLIYRFESRFKIFIWMNIILSILASFAIFYLEITKSYSSIELEKIVVTNSLDSDYGDLFPHIGMVSSYSEKSNLTIKKLFNTEISGELISFCYLYDPFNILDYKYCVIKK